MARTVPLLIFLVFATSCSQSPASDSPPGEPPARVEEAATAPVPSETAVAVQTVVFIGKKKACECTRARVDASWAALEAALEGQGPPVERIDLDVDTVRTKELSALERFMAAPAIYFLNGDGGVVEMLQGEVTEEAFREVLDRG
ncbi:MAG: hypothetical protein JRJ84_11520 [Deltaproteobacteria bacterium]|nr:hypothetical protein [Deltaproteobacteria bacterium]